MARVAAANALLLFQVASAYKCPGSGCLVHAWAEVTAVAAASCADVK
eukprot:CAMPEP_0171063874 /NCGR_PEP_ID=MMETSP0766_2-20121228/5941_1 /TAXON_ID=439317 /ORGANISM="Gambierdiscus australes, Strain CAWD 149" /LENGTH=46 /DNA_ID= /DNA_START= /DNA_END= /DNA_ORIENTATION=